MEKSQIAEGLSEVVDLSKEMEVVGKILPSGSKENIWVSWRKEFPKLSSLPFMENLPMTNLKGTPGHLERGTMISMEVDFVEKEANSVS